MGGCGEDKLAGDVAMASRPEGVDLEFEPSGVRRLRSARAMEREGSRNEREGMRGGRWRYFGL